MILFKKRITKAMIRLRGCAGWSAPVLFANPRRQVFSRRGPYYTALWLLLRSCFWPRGYKTWVHSQTQNKAHWLATCGHVSASSQSLRFILSLRLYSSFITSKPGWWQTGLEISNSSTSPGTMVHVMYLLFIFIAVWNNLKSPFSEDNMPVHALDVFIENNCLKYGQWGLKHQKLCIFLYYWGPSRNEYNVFGCDGYCFL